MQARVPAFFEFKYRRKNSDMDHGMFMKMHAKMMHLIVISKDLSHFRHVHPNLIKKERKFILNANKLKIGKKIKEDSGLRENLETHLDL